MTTEGLATGSAPCEHIAMPYKSLVGVLLALNLGVSLTSREIEVQLAHPELTTPEAKKLVEKLGSGDIPTGLKDAEKLIRRHPDNIELWHILGTLQAQLGEYDEALKSLSRGLRGGKSDLPFLLLMARIHEDRAELGPGGARVGGGVRFKPSTQLSEDPATFSKQELRLAAEKFQQALTIHPEAATYQAKHVSLLLASDDHAAGLTASESYLRINPESGDLLLLYAKAALSLGRWSEARVAAERCLPLLPADPEIHQVMSSLATHEGREDEAAAWMRKARFHSFIPGFLPLPYSEDNYARIAPLFRPKNAEEGEQQKTWVAAAKAAIQTLLTDKSDVSTRLLTAIAWHHEWHGEVENGIFDELEARKAEASLMALFDRANSYCTVGNCAPALARLGSEAAFPLIIERLPMDRNMFSMNLPESLVIYGRPEAIKPLAEALVEAIGEDDRNNASFDDIMGGMGTGMFILRCLRALERFDTPEARAAMEAYADHRIYGTEVNAALFVQTREKRYFDKLLKLLRKSPEDAADIADRIEKAGLPESGQIAAIAKKAAKKKK